MGKFIVKVLGNIIIFGFLSAALAGCHNGPTSSNSSSGQLSISPSSSLTLAPGDSQSIDVSNTGNEPLTNLSFTLGDFTGGSGTPPILVNGCSTTLAAGATCQVSFTLPSDLTTNISTLFRATADGASAVVPIQIVIPTVNIGNNNITAPGTLNVTLANSATTTVRVSNLEIHAESSTGIPVGAMPVPSDCQVLLVGHSCNVPITIASNATGQARLSVMGNFINVNTNLTVSNLTVIAKNASGNALANLIVNPGSTQVVTFANTGNFAVVSPNVLLNGLTDVTIASNTCGTLAANSSCSVTLTGGANPSGTGSIAFTGSNISGNVVTVAVATVDAAHDVAFVPVSRSAQSTSLRGLKYAQIEVTNASGSDISLTNVTSNLSNVAFATDSIHTPSNGCASNGTLASGSSCTFWVDAGQGPDVGTQTGTLTMTYNIGGNPTTETLPMTVNNDLYLYGQFTTTPGQCFNGSTGLTCNNLAKWNGSQWQVVGGIPSIGGTGDNVYSMVTDQNGNIDLATTAPTFSALGTVVNHLASWDGVSWGNFNGGLTAPVGGFDSSFQKLAWSNSNPKQPVLYFIYNSSANADYHLGTWTGNGGAGVINQNAYTFDPSQIISSVVYDVNSNRVYFGSSAGLSDPDVLLYAPANLLSSVSGVSGFANTTAGGYGIITNMLMNANDLYIGGFFDPENTGAVNLMYQYANNQTTAFGMQGTSSNDLDGNLNIQQVQNGELYFTSDYYINSNSVVSGVFRMSTSDLNNFTLIASNTVTSSSGAAFRPNSVVLTHNGTIYATGKFPSLQPNSTPSSCIAKSIATNWEPLSIVVGGTNNIANSCNGGDFNASLLLAPTLTVGS